VACISQLASVSALYIIPSLNILYDILLLEPAYGVLEQKIVLNWGSRQLRYIIQMSGIAGRIQARMDGLMCGLCLNVVRCNIVQVV
jgi:hypothetical protein